MNLSAQTCITTAYQLNGAIGVGETPEAALQAFGLAQLQMMLDEWGAQMGTIPTVDRAVYNFVANQASYTLGTGGDWDQVRPILLTGCAVLLANTPYPNEVPCGMLTDDGYESIVTKTLPSLYPSQFYYNPSFASGLGVVKVWPVPSGTTAQAVIYSPTAVTGFATLTASTFFPPAYNTALNYNLAVRLAIGIRPADPALVSIAQKSFAIIKRANNKLSDLAFDPAITMNGGGPYNILSDTFLTR